MNERRVVAGGAAIALLAALTVAFVLLSPGWAVHAIDRMAFQQLGRHVAAKGGAHLDFSPLSLRLEDATVSGAGEASESLLSVTSLIVPVTLGQLLSRRVDFSAVTLRDAEFALLIDERGQASWDFPQAMMPGRALSLTLEQASVRYFDGRNGQALTVSNVDGLMRIDAEGGVAFTGTAVVNSRVARIDVELKSLQRVNADGSPLQVVVQTDAASASFSGRLSTAKVLSLAGPVTVSSNEPAMAARWAGLPLPRETAVPGPLNLDGALDSAGRAYAVRNASLTLGQFRATGDIVADLRGERPKLQADLRAETLWLDPLVPASGAEPGNWGRKPLSFPLLRSFDAEVSILSRAVAFGAFSAGASRLAAALKDGRLEASGAFRLENGGTASFIAKVDAVVLPPQGSLALKAENAEVEPLLTALTGITALGGTGNLSADLTAQGSTQEELVGTLKGTASLALAQGRLAGIDLGGLATALRERIIDGWSAVPGGTPFKGLEARVDIADGVASIASASAETPALQLTLTGTADLLRRALNLQAALGPPETAPLPVPVMVTGDWAAPRLYPDITDILNNPEGGFARLRTVETPPDN